MAASIAAAAALWCQAAAGQEPATLTGRVLGPEGAPIEAASVFIESLNVGALSNAQGRYLLIIPASRVTGQVVKLRAGRLISVRSVVRVYPGP